MLRVLYCTDFLSIGGVESQLVELVTRLDQVEAQVICLYADKWDREQHFALADNPVQVLDLGVGPQAKLAGVLAIIRHTWRFRPQIVHAVNYHSNLLSRLARPFMPPRTCLIGAVRVQYTSKQLRYERWSHRLCWRIVCNSPHLQRQLIEHISPQKVIMIPNGVDLQRFAESHPRQTGGEECVFLSIGRISEQKAQHLIIEALLLMKSARRLSRDMRVLVIGVIEDTWVQSRIDVAMPELEAVLFQQAATDKPEIYYRAADVVLLPSLYEGLPNVALESLAMGRPIILSEKANAAGIITDGVEGWVVRTGDVSHLAETMMSVAALPRTHLAAMGESCRRRAQDFAMSRMIQRYQQLYSEGKLT